MDTKWRPRAYRTGSVIAILQGKQADAGIVASSQTNVGISSPYRKYAILRAGFQLTIAPAGSLPITINLIKSFQGGNTTFNADFDLRGQPVNQVIQIPLASNINSQLNDLTSLFVLGDGGGAQTPARLFVAVVAQGTVTTQPVGLIITVEVAVQD